MDWYRNALSRRYAIRGMLMGLFFPLIGTLIEIARRGLSLTFASILTVQSDEPLLWIIDTAPLVLGYIAAILGTQKSLSEIVERGKKEWEATFDALTDLIFITDSAGRIIRCNHAVIDRLNTTYTFVLGQPLAEIFTSAGQGEELDFQKNQHGFSWLGRLFDVSTYSIEVSGTERQNLFILQDITLRVKMESNLSRERTLLRTLIDNLPDRIYVKDLQGIKTVSNTADWRAAGASRMEDVLGKSDFDVYPAELAMSYQADDRTVLDGGVQIFNREEPGLDHEGNPAWIMTTKVPLHDDTGKIVGLVGVGRDITTQKLVQEKLRQLSLAVEQSPANIVITNLDGDIVYVNSKFTQTTGYPSEETLGKNPRILKSGFTPPHEYKRLWDTIKSGRTWNGEFYNRKKNGDLYWESATISAIMNENGEPTHFLAVKEDITERKRMSEKLAKSEAELRALFGAMQDVVMVFDRQGRYVQIAPTSTQQLYQSPQEMLGKTVFDVLPQALAQRIYDSIQEVLQTNKMVHVEYMLKPEDSQEEVWKDAAVSPLTQDTVFWIARDITERKRIEAELLREKHFQEALIRNSPTSIVVLDNHGNIVSCNPAFEQLFGYAASEAAGKNLDSLLTTPETIDQARTYTHQSLTGRVHGFGKRRRRDGSFASVEIFGVPLIVSEERIGTLAIYHDITELERARMEAEEASHAKSEFLANMSHEIRTPMNGVMGMLELALETPLTSEQRDYLETSLHSAEALLAILNDILDFSKIEAGRLELEKINFNLRNTVEDVAYTLAARAQGKGLEMACLIHPDISADLRGDPGRLRQILVNLVGNAIKFTHQGEIVIQAEPIKETESEAIVHFSVQDTGIGISPERKSAIFDRFTQADGSTTRKYGGTGLGLTISKQLVEVMGGKIGVESTPGVGSTFWFDLTFEKQPPEKRGTAPLSLLGPVKLSAARILVVDDNQTNRFILTKNVEAMGCRVDSVASGAKALESLRNAHRLADPYHLVLLDMQMPAMDGEQTARAIKSDPAVKDVKILILTSMGHRGDAARMESLGCSGYLLKPVKQQMLFDATMAVLGREKVESPALITRHILAEQRKFGLRLLLAEDNPINQKLAITVLQKAGYSVDSVDNGQDAVSKAKANQYNAILMDIQMPDIDGFEATQQIRAWEEDHGGHIPIIAMTAHAMQGDRERCLEAGMDDYVTKPLHPPVLISALNRWIQDDAARTEREKVQDYSSQPDTFSIDFGDGMFGEFASQPAADRSPLSEQRAVLSADTLPVDLPSAIARFDDDRDFVLSIILDFKNQLPDRLKEVRQYLHAGDASSLGRIAHNLKGVSLNISAAPIAQAALEIEQSASRDDLTGAADHVAQLEREVVRFEEFMSNMNL